MRGEVPRSPSCWPGFVPHETGRAVSSTGNADCAMFSVFSQQVLIVPRIPVTVSHGIPVTVSHGISVTVKNSISVTVNHGIPIPVNHGIQITVNHGIYI